MKIAYFDLISGASGDMILGAMIDAGLSAETLKNGLAGLKLADFDLNVYEVTKNFLTATKVDVIVKDNIPERHISEIQEVINRSELSELIKQQALAIFRRLGTVEAAIHGMELEHIHLHELGGVDTIVDVVGTLISLEALNIKKVYASPIPLGRGFTKGAHGQIPLPAPATVALLEGIPVYGSDLTTETVTPTGAVLLSSLADGFGPIPEMELHNCGYGAGGRDLPIPNVLRVLIGEQVTPHQATSGLLTLLETNIDDLNPEIYNHVMELLFSAGALDVYFTPIQMKKNRPGVKLSVLCQDKDSANIQDILFIETSTLGVREMRIQRNSLERKFQKIETPWGEINIKLAYLPNGGIKFTPEYEDCHRLAKQHNIAIREVYNTAIKVASQEF